MTQRAKTALVITLLVCVGAGFLIAQIGAPVRNLMPCVAYISESQPAGQVPCSGQGGADERLYVLTGAVLTVGALATWARKQRGLVEVSTHG